MGSLRPTGDASPRTASGMRLAPNAGKMLRFLNAPNTLPILAVATLLISAADHWTTFVCLRAPVTGWEVHEGNPIAAWLFGRLGLTEGLMVDSIVTLLAIVVLVQVAFIPRWAKLSILGVVVTATSVAVASNLVAVYAMNLSLIPII